MATLVTTPNNPDGRIIGPRPTGRFSMPGGDLSYFWRNKKGYTHSLHGDTFNPENPNVLPHDWRSPTSLRTSNNPDDGIVWDNAVGGGYARQILDYNHSAPHPANPDDAITHIPNDGLQLPNGDTVISTFAVYDWTGNTTAKTWMTHCAALWITSQPDAETYNPGPYLRFYATDPKFFYFQNQSMVLFQDYVYVYGTVGGRSQDGGVYLMRHHWTWMNNMAGWEFWGKDAAGNWGWSNNRQPTAMFYAQNMTDPNQSKIGELNVQLIGTQFVMAYTDYSLFGQPCTVTRVANSPTGLWSAPVVQVGPSWDMHYAPGIHPQSTVSNLHFGLSRWHYPNSDPAKPGTPPFEFYGVWQWKGSALSGGGSPSLMAGATARDAGFATERGALEVDDVGVPTATEYHTQGNELGDVSIEDLPSVMEDYSAGEITASQMRDLLDGDPDRPTMPLKPGAVRAQMEEQAE